MTLAWQAVCHCRSLILPSILLYGFTAILFIFFFFSPATLWAPWTELGQKRPYARKWVRFENACLKSEVYSPPKNHFFRRLPNLTATLTAYIFGTKHNIHCESKICAPITMATTLSIINRCAQFFHCCKER